LRVPASQDRIAVQFLREPRADVGEFDPRHGSVDDAEGAFDVCGGFGLRVERVMVTGAAEGPDEDAIDGTTGFPFCGARLLLVQQELERYSQSAQAGDFKDCASVDTFTIMSDAGEQVEHR